MNIRSWLTVLLVSCFALALPKCSALPSKKAAVKAQPQMTTSPTTAIEWKDREWESYADERGVKYYFEKKSIDYPQKNIIHVWRKRTFPVKSSSHKEITSLDEIDCRDDKYRSLEVQGLSWDDTPTPIYKRPTPWVSIYSNSPDDYFVVNYCRRADTSGKPPAK